MSIKSPQTPEWRHFRSRRRRDIIARKKAQGTWGKAEPRKTSKGNLGNIVWRKLQNEEYKWRKERGLQSRRVPV